MQDKRKVRKTYSEEFKKEAVARSLLNGISNTCNDLDISSSALSRWKNEYNNSLELKKGSKLSYVDLEKEVRRLKKELGYVEEINRVLKKSTAIFSDYQLKNLK